jgi:molybdate transport system substrate-binding protein
MKKLVSTALSIVLLITVKLVQAETVTVAVASNFSAAMKEIAGEFEKDTGHKVQLVFSSSGKLYAQITHGAPFQVFLSADVIKTQRLEKEGLIVPGSRFIYAIGSLVLWSANHQYINNSSDILQKGTFKYIAVANPKLAPYGIAARETLDSLDLLTNLQSKFVQGENIAQTYQFVASSNAELGFVAASQVIKQGKIVAGSGWVVPLEFYQAIKQEAVLLASGKNNAAAISLVSYLHSDKSKAIIKSYGYH